MKMASGSLRASILWLSDQASAVYNRGVIISGAVVLPDRSFSLLVQKDGDHALVCGLDPDPVRLQGLVGQTLMVQAGKAPIAELVIRL